MTLDLFLLLVTIPAWVPLACLLLWAALVYVVAADAVGWLQQWVL